MQNSCRVQSTAPVATVLVLDQYSYGLRPVQLTLFVTSLAPGEFDLSNCARLSLAGHNVPLIISSLQA